MFTITSVPCVRILKQYVTLGCVESRDLTLIRAAVQIDVAVRLEVIYDSSATNRREGVSTVSHAAAVVGISAPSLRKS